MVLVEGRSWQAAVVPGRAAAPGHAGMEVVCGGVGAGADPAEGRWGASFRAGVRGLGIAPRSAFGHRTLALCHIEPQDPTVGFGGAERGGRTGQVGSGRPARCPQILRATETPVLRGAYLVVRAMRRISQRRRDVLTNESVYRLSRAAARAGLLMAEHGGAGELLPRPTGRSEPQPPPVMDGAAALVPVPAPCLSGEQRSLLLWKMLCSLSVSQGHRVQPVPSPPFRVSRSTADPLFVFGTSSSSGTSAKYSPERFMILLQLIFNSDCFSFSSVEFN